MPISDVIDYDKKDKSVDGSSVYKWVNFFISVTSLFLDRFEFQLQVCDRVNFNFTMSDQRYYTLAEGELSTHLNG